MILHCDLDCFYASVAMQENPELKGKCVAVCGDVSKRHGIILAKSYPAKKYGIKTGMAIWEAKQLCPELILVPANFAQYKYYSELVRNIYCRYTDQVEAFGLDENWVDITGSLHLFEKTPYDLAKRIQNEILQETGLTVSIGIGWNKIIAKFGSDYKKPYGITNITEENFQDIFWNAPVEDLLYVGRKTEVKLKRWGINTIGDLARDEHGLVERHGGKIGRMLIWWARGFDATPVASIYAPETPPKSVGNSITTPKDIVDFRDCQLVLQVLAEAIATRLKRQHLKGKVISVYVRNSELKSAGKQRKVNVWVDTREQILQVAYELVNEIYDFELPLRSVGISVSSLTASDVYMQEDIFRDIANYEEEYKLDQTIDNIRRKFGSDKVMRCSVLCDRELTDFNPLSHDVHPVGYLHST